MKTLYIDPLPKDGQAWFAEQVRDFNPVHLSDRAGRNSIFGAKIVHGVHSTIRQLDAMAQHGLLSKIDPDTGFRLKINYRQPTYPSDQIRVEIDDSKPNRIGFKAFIDEVCVSTGLISMPGKARSYDDPISGEQTHDLAQMDKPLDLAFDDICAVDDMRIVAHTPLAKGLESRYPHIAKIIGCEKLFSFGCLSSLVGMTMPGLYSLFIGVDCHFREKQSKDSSNFKIDITHRHQDFKFVKYMAANANLQAKIEAVNRPRPTVQPAYADVENRVNGLNLPLADMTGKTALIIGGSRGLGATCARMLYKLGANVTLTYAHDKAAAEAVRSDLGEEVSVLKFDINASTTDLSQTFDHIYYFATPQIFVRKTKTYDRALFDKFVNFYVDGFLRTVKQFAHQRSSIFYPSSIEVEGSDMNTIEYRTSKAAGETLCKSLQKNNSDQNYVVTRLPRLASDQTATLQPGENADTIETLAAVIREMR